MFTMNKAVCVKWSAGAALLIVLTSGMTSSARTAEGQPIFEFIGDAVVAGEPLNCTVGLTSGGTNVNIYSNPPGAVSYQGYVGTSTTTVPAATDTTGLEPGTTVTVYAETDGTTTVAAQTTVAPTATDVVPAH